MKTLAKLSLALALAACADGTGPRPQATSLEGVWTAPTAGSQFHTVRVEIVLDLSTAPNPGTALGGVWSVQLTGCTLTGCPISGVLINSTRTGNNVRIEFSPTTSCLSSFAIITATLTSPNTLSGIFVRRVCGGPDDAPAPITLTRQ